jgi:hypothetical protein
VTTTTEQKRDYYVEPDGSLPQGPGKKPSVDSPALGTILSKVPRGEL